MSDIDNVASEHAGPSEGTGEHAPTVSGAAAEVVRPDAVTESGAHEVEEIEVVTESVTEPGKVMRIGSMVKQLLEEVRNSSLDEASRERLAEIYERSVVELSDALSPDLQQELHLLALPFDHEGVPSESELRVAKAQLVGWLEGLFHGIQASLMAQQAVAQAQLRQMRQLPGGPGGPGSPGGPGGPGGPGSPGGFPGEATDSQSVDRPGTYL